MPLPRPGVAWPPPLLAAPTTSQTGRGDPLLNTLGKWSAWYAGDSDQLAALYSGAGQPVVRNRAAQYRGGLVGSIARWFWGQPTSMGEQRTKLHIPVAADLCQASADLLFSDPPAVTVDNNGTQDRLAYLAGDGLHAELASAAEVAAALGGVFLRVAWDKQVSDGPFLTHADADNAVPEFTWGRLTAVTFWRVLHDDGSTTMRHLERHETTPDGTGVILHGLYQGGPNQLGQLVPLTEHPQTEALAPLVDDNAAITTGSPGLAVVYVPNQTPQRRWRNHPLGMDLGRSDLDGIEPEMDALDETYSSWMRDIRVGKGRVFIADSLLDDLGPGQGAAWDQDREVYAPVRALAGRDSGSGLPLHAQQFAIRVQEHRDTAQELLSTILRTAGYSAQTFGEGDQGAAATATEITARQQRSFLTRGRKIRLWRPALAQAVEKLLAVDAAVFGSGVTVERPTVEFAPGVQESPLTLAQTAQALRGAEAASTETIVAMVHPDWDDAQVTEEVDRIAAEAPAPVPDVDTFGRGSEPEGGEGE